MFLHKITQPIRISNPAEACQAGITLIYQELNVAPNLTVAENMFMGSELSRGQLLDREGMYREAGRVLKILGANFAPEDIVSSLAIAAVIWGGTSFTGGIGTIPGTLLGALIIAVLNNGLTLLNMSYFWQLVVKGLVIIVAVTIDRLRRRGNR